MMTLRKKYIAVLCLLSLTIVAGMRWSNRTVLKPVTAATTASLAESTKPIVPSLAPGMYASLGEAVQAARYNVRAVSEAGRNAVMATNPANSLRAVFTPEQVQVQAASACQQPWQFGLKLKGYGYGTQLHEVTAGEISTQNNRVEIKRALATSQSAIQTPPSAITEWYANTPKGIEQGFTIQERPRQNQAASLRIVMEMQGEWKAKLEANGQALTLHNNTTALRYDQLHTFDATGRELASRMELAGTELALVVNDKDAVWPLTIDPTLSQQTQFLASNGTASDQFGYAVAISGDTAIVGVPSNDASGTFNQGAAYVFVRNGSTWSQQAQLVANDAANNDAFGWSVAVSGDTAVIGSYNDDVGSNGDQGSAYVFVRSGSTWSQQAKLTSSNGATNDWFGYSVAVSGDRAVIGAPLNDASFTSNQGSAYVFVRSGSSWSQEVQVNASDAADNDNFGYAVALSGTTAVVGSPAHTVNGNSYQGAAYIFVRNGSSWSQQQQLTASNGLSNDQFGFSVALSGDTAVVGAPQDDVGANSEQGSAYVFVRNGSAWSQQQQLIASNGASADQFGYAVAISNDMVTVGAPNDDVNANTDQGSAYVFARTGSAWSQQQQLIASNGAAFDNLGWGIAISGYTIVVGAPQDDVSSNADQGSAYIFSPTCPSITLSPTTLSNGTQNLAYSTTSIVPSSGTSPFTYEVSSGTLPSGLTLSASGVVSGTPTAAGSYNFTIKITDVNLCVGSRAYSMTIASCAPPTVTTQPTNQSAAVAGSATFTAAAGGTPPTVQWQVSTDNGTNWINLTGETNATLSLNNLAITMNGNKYRAVFTNACGTATSDPATLTVNKLTPTVALTSSSSTVTYGQSVTLTATVSGAVAASGTVTFKNGATTLSTGTLSGGQATFASATLGAGSYSITAEYSGDTNYVGNTSSAISQTINKATLTVTAENKAKIYGAANPDLTATITGFVNNESNTVVRGAAALTTNATVSSNVGDYPITAAIGTLAAANYNFSFVNGTLTVNQAALTVTADDKARIYGAANPSFTATISGFVNNENQSALGGALQFNTTANSGSPVGTYPITVSGLTSSNYAITFVNGTLTVNKATLTVTAENKAKSYGAAVPALTATITGFVNSETSNVISGAATLTTTATTASPVGDYGITAASGTLAASNYNFTFVDGTLTVNKAVLTVTADNKSRGYGSANPTLTATLSGFVNGENSSVVSGAPSLSTTATLNSPANTYPITVTQGTLTATNYDFTFVNGTLTVGKAILTFTAENKTKVFGAALPELTYSVTGFLNGDTASVITGAPSLTTTATATSNVGQYPISIAAGSLAAANYDLAFVSGTLTVSKATLVVTADNKSRIYGMTNPAFTATLSGFVNGDNASVLTGEAALSTAATASSAAGVYPITAAQGTLAASNYDFSFVNGALTVGKVTLTVTVENKTRTYGAPNPLLTTTMSGFVNNDTISVISGEASLNTTATISSAVGSYPIVATQGTLAAANYDFTFVNGTLTIGQATLTVTAENANRVYGAANPNFAVHYSGFVNNDSENSLTGTPDVTTTATAASPIGNYPITVKTGTLSASNYQLTFVDGTLSVGKASLTAVANNATRTYGAANPKLTGTLSGVQNNDNITASYTTAATASHAVGTYDISPTLNDPDNKQANYDVTLTKGTLTVTQATLTVTADHKARPYGAANPALTATITGFVNDETQTVLGGAVQLNTEANAGSVVGNYPITVSGVSSSNYAITFVNGTLTVNKAMLTVTAENKARTYGVANPDLTATITGFVNGDTSSVISGAAALSTTATNNSAVNTYPITVTQGTLTATNYDFTFVNGTLTIGKATITVTADNKTKVFGAALPDFTYSYAGFSNGDTASVVTGAPSLTTTATASSNVGEYPISISAGSLATANYDFIFANGKLTINPANTTLTLVSDTPAALVGQNVKFTAISNVVAPGTGTPTGTITFKNGSTTLGTAQLSNGQASFTTNQLAIGTYSITASYSGADNFNASASQVVSQSVGKSAATVTVASSLETATYGQPVTLNASVSGTGSTPTGTLRFMDGSSLLGTATLANGAASFTVNVLSVATHNITAVYEGDAQNEGGTSRNFSLTVNKAKPTLNVASSANPAAWKQFITLAVNLGNHPQGVSAPTGSVVFKDGSTVLGTSAIDRLGRASFTTNQLTGGAHSITAEFSGDGNYEANQSAALPLTISKGTTTIRLTSSAKISTYGQSLYFTAAVYSTGDTPTGIVEFYDAATLLGEAPLSGSAAVFTTSALSDGERSITAVYKGDDKSATSKSAPLKQTISSYCVWNLSTTNMVFNPQGGFGQITVESPSYCYWYAYTTNNWITVTDYGPEVGAVSFNVAPLTTGTSRTGTIFVADKRVTIVQTKTTTSVSGASFQQGSIAAHSIVSVFGEGMAAATESAQSIPLPTVLAQTKVKITDNNGATHFAPLFYVSPLQINYQIPADVAQGPALVTVQDEAGNITGGGMIDIAPISPAVFSANSSGKDLAAANIQRVRVDGSQSFEPIATWDTAQNKIVPVPIDMGEEGEEVYLVLYGTGIRSRIDLISVRATVNGEDTEVLYADTQGYFVGVDQINLKLNRKLAGKGEVDVKLLVENKVVNTVRINLK